MKNTFADIINNDKNTLIVITGISASGKSTLAKKLSKKCNYPVLSMDDYKVRLYEEYGFLTEYERKNLWNTAKNLFCADIIKYARSNRTIIIEYPFDCSWQKFFDYITENYDICTVVINCNSRDFDDIWMSRSIRDTECIDRPKCLTASKYIKGVLYKSNNKITDEYRMIKQQEYFDEKYTSIQGKYTFSDIEIIEYINTN